MKWIKNLWNALSWEQDTKKVESTEWRPILKFWIIAILIIFGLLFIVGAANAPFKIS